MPPIDADKTLHPGEPVTTGSPGDFVSSSSFFGHTLPEGTRVGEFVVKGHDPYQVSFYTLGSVALADGHVFYGSYNGHVYCFGDAFRK